MPPPHPAVDSRPEDPRPPPRCVSTVSHRGPSGACWKGWAHTCPHYGRLSGGTGPSRWLCHLGVARKGGRASDGVLRHHLYLGVCVGGGTQQRAEASQDRWPGDWEHRSQTGRERQGRPHPTCLPARPLRGPDLVGAQGRWPMGARPPAHSRALPPAPGAGLHTSGSTETGAAPHQERWGLLRSSCPVQGQGLRGCPPPSRLSREQQERDQVLARLRPPPAAAALGTLGALSLWPCHCGL